MAEEGWSLLFGERLPFSQLSVELIPFLYRRLRRQLALSSFVGPYYRSIDLVVQLAHAERFYMDHFTSVLYQEQSQMPALSLPEVIDTKFEAGILTGEDVEYIKPLAMELVQLDARPIEHRREVARAVAFALRDHEQCLFDGSSGIITEEKMAIVKHTVNWRTKVPTAVLLPSPSARPR